MFRTGLRGIPLYIWDPEWEGIIVLGMSHAYGNILFMGEIRVRIY